MRFKQVYFGQKGCKIAEKGAEKRGETLFFDVFRVFLGQKY
jgi:hypothetical protein